MKWRGDKDHQGRKKKETAAEIAKYINEGGVLEKRNPAQVLAQMSRLESNMRAAYDFCCTETGAGLLESDKVTFEDAVRKKCSYYFELKEIMCDRASVKPKATSEECLDSSDDDEELDLDSILGVSDDKEVSTDGGITPQKSSTVEGDGVSQKDDASQVSSVKKKGVGAKRKKSTIAPGRRNVISLLPEDNAKYDALATAKEALARAKIRKIEQETEEKALDKEQKVLDKEVMDERRNIERVLYKMKQLKFVREQNPELDEEQICLLFPDLKDVIEKMKN